MREISREVKTEWLESVEEWKPVKWKSVPVVKKEELLPEMKIHLSKPSSFKIIGQTIRSSVKWQSCLIDRELKSV